MTPVRMTPLLALLAACGDDPAPSLLDELADEGRFFLEVEPPINSACGWVQPGFDGSDPMNPLLDGEPYNPLDDTSCSIARGYRWGRDARGIYVEWWRYIIDMGEPADPAMLPEHLDAAWPAARDSTLSCWWKWRVEAERVEDYPLSDVVRIRGELEDVSYYCSGEYAPGGWVPGEPLDSQMLLRSTDPEVVIQLGQGLFGDDLFQGFVGLPDTGGAESLAPEETGFAFFYRACEPHPGAQNDWMSTYTDTGGEGPGVCEPDCRLFSGTSSIEACTWEHVRALPVERELIDPSWIESYGHLYDLVFVP